MKNKKILSILCIVMLTGCTLATTSSPADSSSQNTTGNIVTSPTIKDILGGTGDAYDPYMVEEGAYHATLKKDSEVVYYGFRPNRPGKYVIESLLDDTSVINPNVGYYGNNPQYVPESPINDMIDDDSGKDNNFSLNFNIAIEEFVNTGEVDKDGNVIYQKDENGNLVAGGVYLFGIAASGITSSTIVPFSVTWLEDYIVEKPKIEEVKVTSALSAYPNKPANYVWVDASIDGTLNVVYSEDDGFYHVDDKDGYILTAKISEPCLYLDKAFSKTDEETQLNEGIVGERNIILANGTKDYSKFIMEYEKYCNSDGVYGVTEELKVFLEDYFYANKAWIESCLSSTQVLDDESGWMFACGYYADISDSYKRPTSGNGTLEDAYVLASDGNTYEYYAKVPSAGSIYYSYAIRNDQKEVHIYVKTSEPNAKFVYNDVEYTINEGVVYLEVDLGGGMATRNPNEFTFEMTSVDNNGANFVFEVGIREDTVAGDALILGENTVEVPKNGYVDCSFSAPEAGTYTFTCNEPNAWIEYNGNDYKGSDGEITFSATLETNEKFEFDIYTLNFSREYITFTISLDRIAKTINTATIGYESNGRDIEKLKYKLIADDEGGTYTITPSVGTMIIVEKAFSSESYWNEAPLVVTLEPNEVFIFLVTVEGWTPGPVSFTVSKA